MRCPSPLSRPLPARPSRWQSAFRIWSERMRSCPPPRFVPARGRERLEPQNMRCPSPLSRPLPAGLWRWQSAFRIWSERMRSCPPPRFVPARGRERLEPQNMRCPSPLSRPLPAGLWRWQSAFRARRGAEESAQSLPIYEYPAGENIACGARENPSALFYSCGMAGFVDSGPSIPRRIAQYRAGLRSRSRAVRALFCHVRTECASARRTGA